MLPCSSCTIAAVAAVLLLSGSMTCVCQHAILYRLILNYGSSLAIFAHENYVLLKQLVILVESSLTQSAVRSDYSAALVRLSVGSYVLSHLQEFGSGIVTRKPHQNASKNQAQQLEGSLFGLIPLKLYTNLCCRYPPEREIRIKSVTDAQTHLHVQQACRPFAKPC